MIPDETFARIREAADIVEIVGEHVKLRRTGNSWRGPCPFHGGRNPNFSVSQSSGAYHCFKCGVGGDVFGFLQEHLGVSFMDAVRMVGERYGIEVRDVATRQRERDPREPLWEVLAAAEEWFVRQLWDGDTGREARSYLERRAVPRELAERFALGYAPRGTDGGVGGAKGLREHLRALGFDDERQVAAGILVLREGESSPRPRFRGRLMFPIHDASDRPNGFGGRATGDFEPKYLNSPESEVFQKRRLLYGLHLGRNAIRKEERALVVEGYMDVVRLHGAGLQSVVAPLGTALTTEQADALARLSPNVFLLYDSDEAGLKATFRAGLELLRLGVAPRVVSLPDGEDPDTFVRARGVEALERQLAASVDLFERQLQLLERGGWLTDLSRKRRAIDKLLPTIRAAADPLTRDVYIGTLAERAQVDRELLRQEAESQPRRRGSGSHSAGGSERHGAEESGDEPPVPADEYRAGFRRERPAWRDRRDWKHRGRRGEIEWRSDLSRPRVVGTGGERAERNLVLVLLHLPERREQLVHDVHVEDFRSPVYAELFAELGAVDGPLEVEALAEQLTSEAVEELQRLLEASGELIAPIQLMQDSIASLRLRSLKEQSEELQRMMLEVSDPERKDILLREKIRIRAEMAALRPGSGPATLERAREAHGEEIT